MALKKTLTSGFISAAFGLFVMVAGSGVACATNVSTIAKNITASAESVPALIAGASYLLSLLFGVLGILKLKDHVENPSRTELKDSIIRFLVAGGLVALPIVYEAMLETIGNGGFGGGGGFTFIGLISGALGGISNWIPGGTTFNQILSNIVQSFESVPGLISGMAYLLGLVFGVGALLKLKEHVENPQNTPMREPVIRFIVGGALFALPAVFTAMKKTIEGGGIGAADIFTDLTGNMSLLIGMTQCGRSLIGSLLGGLGGLLGWLGFGVGNANPTIGNLMCNLFWGTSTLPAFFSACAYLFGIVLGVWAILKVKEHVLNPQQVQIWDPVSKMIAAGCFFALPTLLRAAKSTIGALFAFRTSGANGSTSGNGLDAMIVRFVEDIYGPMMFLMNWTGYVIGIILIMIGVTRLMKSAQEGPRGPGGLGTMMTFIVGAAFLSFSPMLGAITTTMFSGGTAKTAAALAYTSGMTNAEVNHVNAVISSVIKFMIVLGAVSFARGIYIFRQVAEGNGQASMMSGITHVIGGALAVNLGSVVNALQRTLGLTGYGVNFN